MEIERKFLVRQLPDELDQFERAEISQCYLDFGGETSPERRIRSMSTANSVKYFYTEKGMGDLARSEEEKEIDREKYLSLKNENISKEIKKIRYYLSLTHGLTAELDVYDGFLKGLITVEVEFSSLADAEGFSAPCWFGEEITYDKHYRNKNLAKIQ